MKKIQAKTNFGDARSKQIHGFRLARSKALGIERIPGTGLIPEILAKLARKLAAKGGNSAASVQ